MVGVILAVEHDGKHAAAFSTAPGEIILYVGKQLSSRAIGAILWKITIGIRLSAQAHCRSSSAARSTHSRNCSPSRRCSLIVPERYPELIADLEKRTGLKIKRARIGKLDFMRDTATIEVFTEGAGEKGLVKYNSDSRISVKSDMDDDD